MSSFFRCLNHTLFAYLQGRREANGSVRDTRLKAKRIRKRVAYEGEGDPSNEWGFESMQRLPRVDDKALPLSKRIALQKEASDRTSEIKSRFGAKEVSYVPKSHRKVDATSTEQTSKSGTRKRRGAKSK